MKAPTSKEKLYKTAFSPLYNCYVKITHAYTNDVGDWLFYCDNDSEGLKDVIFNKRELTNFCL